VAQATALPATSNQGILAAHKESSWRLRFWSALAAIALAGGCTTSIQPAVSPTGKPGHWVNLPGQTGSLLAHRVWKNDDGTFFDPESGTIYNADPRKVQDRRLVNPAPANPGR